ncbi:hypothetical protein CWR53_22905 [Pseudomonas sp. SGAir0191]|uniref:hypothetical protein n=1 Tax=Pseudomonas sp. SGAir0191 TaxID=2217867 RepID=UPI0010FC5B47|nr:hypothetical protein [Pseudomonas sp. SGAir0191]QCU71447.1 hypothetical protein CWR53_22905 [Pseudomonas sp. SGAir0191]
MLIITFEYGAFEVALRVGATENASVSFDGGINWHRPAAVSEQTCIFPMPADFSLVADSVLVRGPDNEISTVAPPLEFDVQRSHDIHYLNKMVFNFRSRISDKTIFYHYLRSLLLSMDRSSKFYLGVLSVLAFRVGEDPVGRADVGREIVHIRKGLITEKPIGPLDPVTLRWWISSGTNIIPLAEFYQLRESAFDIAKDIYEMRDESARARIVYWNTASSMLLYGFYLYDKGLLINASEVFLSTFILCQRGLSEIFVSSNKSILSQYPDCTALIEIGRNAFAAHSVLSGSQFPPGSTAEYPVDLENYYIDFIGAVRRHDKSFPPKLGYFIELKDRLNKAKAALFKN